MQRGDVVSDQPFDLTGSAPGEPPQWQSGQFVHEASPRGGGEVRVVEVQCDHQRGYSERGHGHDHDRPHTRGDERFPGRSGQEHLRDTGEQDERHHLQYGDHALDHAGQDQRDLGGCQDATGRSGVLARARVRGCGGPGRRASSCPSGSSGRGVSRDRVASGCRIAAAGSSIAGAVLPAASGPCSDGAEARSSTFSERPIARPRAQYAVA